MLKILFIVTSSSKKFSVRQLKDMPTTIATQEALLFGMVMNFA